MNARDIAIRTILGEAAGESPMAQAAVAHVLLNRARDPRWPSTVEQVALQPKQFSAWNTGAGGNDLVSKYGPGSDPYERVGAVYDSVMSGGIPDPTGGATHYYSPAGMQALVSQGAQSNLMPGWLKEENRRRGGNPTTIGGHVFTGLADGLSFGPDVPAMDAPKPSQPLTFGNMTEQSGLAGLIDFDAVKDAFAPEEQVAQPYAPAPGIMPVQAQPYQPKRRDTLAPYLSLFESLTHA